MSKNYTNPPVVEAVCEFQFIPDQEWDSTIPGLFYEKIKGSYPNKKQLTNIKLQPTLGKADTMVQRVTPKTQFYNSANNCVLQVGVDLFAVNHLKPYPKWDVFKQTILSNLNLYLEIAKPKGFNRIGLRYINRFDYEAPVVELEDYFNFYPHIPKALPGTHEDFLVRVEFPIGNERDRLLMNFSSVVSERIGMLSLMLDMDYIMNKPQTVGIGEAEKWIEEAHTYIEKAFEDTITDKTRDYIGLIKK